MIFPSSFLPIDSLSFFMLVLVAVLFPLVFIFSLGYVKRNRFRYYFVLFITFFGLLGVVLARDWLSFYICLELMTVGVYFLIVDNTKKASFPAGFKYVMMMFAGGLFILVASLMLYNLTGSFDFAVIARVSHILPDSTQKLILGLFVIGFLIEIGSVPFHVWLPDAHPIAPSPVSALLSGLVIKTGAYGLIRALFIFQIEMQILVWLGVISMLFGVIMAIQQNNIKRLLAYSSVSQMGYVVLGIGIGTSFALGGSLFHILNHAMIKMLLFLAMGAIIFVTKERELNKLGGLAPRMPITALVFAVGALALAGIFPFNGFYSKALLSQAALGDFWLKGVLLLTSAGTFAALFKLFVHVFTGDTPAKLKKVKEVGPLMYWPLIILASLCLLVGLFPYFVIKILPLPPQALSSFSFFSAKRLLESMVVVFVGICIYGVMVNHNLLMVFNRFKRLGISFSYLSLDKFYCGLASLVEWLCNNLKKVMRRSLNTYVLWVFLMLTVLLLIFSFYF